MACTVFTAEEYKPGIWKTKKRKHKRSVDRLIGDYMFFRKRGHKNPVFDFLFEYYSFPVGRLRRWSPGVNVKLLGDDILNDIQLNAAHLRNNGSLVQVDPFTIPPRRRPTIRWILSLLQQTKHQPASFGCFGMHEWAMVYRTNQRRHPYVPFRLPQKAIDQLVESRSIACTHYQAFRFFSESAKPLNHYQPRMDKRQVLEQPGCLHTNMDLYKWAFKMYPWISSNTILEAFELALKARKLDMKASPYDLRAYGYDPIKIETRAGRRTYQQRQKLISAEARSVRKKLIREYQLLAEVLEV